VIGVAARTRARGCAGQLAHGSPQGAQVQIARLVAQRGAPADAYEAYECRWHVGHRNPRKRGGRRA
jgi:hypothetical protein